MSKKIMPFVSFAPYMRGGDATLNNSQSGAEHKVTRWWLRVDDLKSLQSDFDVSRPDLLVACWYYGTHGTGKWKKRFGAWAEQWRSELWHRDWNHVPDPPQKEPTASPRSSRPLRVSPR